MPAVMTHATGEPSAPVAVSEALSVRKERRHAHWTTGRECCDGP